MFIDKHISTGKTAAQTGTQNGGHLMESGWVYVGDELASRDAKYVEGESLVDMVKEDLAAQRIAVDCCRDIIQYMGGHDPVTRRKLEDVLVTEGERAGESAKRLTF